MTTRAVRRRQQARTEAAPYYAEVGSRIRAARLHRGHTVEVLAADVGVTERQMHRWEAGDVAMPLHRLPIIAAALGVAPGDLLPDDDAADEPIPFTLTATAADLACLARLASQEPTP